MRLLSAGAASSVSRGCNGSRKVVRLLLDCDAALHDSSVAALDLSALLSLIFSLLNLIAVLLNLVAALLSLVAALLDDRSSDRRRCPLLAAAAAE